MAELASAIGERESHVDAAIAEYLIARQDGRAFDRSDWLARHADVAEELRDFLKDEEHVGGMLAPLQQEHSTPGPNLCTDPNATLTHGGSGDTATSSPGIDRLGDYEILEEIARGGMGVVFRARQKSLNRIVALKMVLGNRLASKKDIERFQREAEAAAGLDHPNIVPIYEVGAIDEMPFFSMKLIEGGSLTRSVRSTFGEGTPHAPREDFPRENYRRIATLMAKVARAVHHAHQRGILHRDLKPSNVLLDSAGEPHVADFGLAKRIEDVTDPNADNTQTGAVVGTPSYMAPEQARGQSKQLTTAADVYGLGAILYDLLTGQPPFRANSPGETLLLVLSKEVERPSHVRSVVPRDLETICLKCLEKEASKRYGSAEALAADLERWLRGEPIEAWATGRLERAIKWVRRNPMGAGLASVSALLVLVAVGGVVALGYSRTLKGKNQDLEAAKSEADEQRKEADKQRERAREEEARAYRYLYVTRMTLVRQAQGDAHRVVQLLRSVIPERPDQEDLRGPEWYHLWRQYQGEESRLRGHTGAVLGVAFNRDGSLLASASADGTVRLWDVVGGNKSRVLTGHTGSVAAIAFNPDSTHLASAGADGTLRVWEVAGGTELRSIQLDAPATAVAYSLDGKSLLSAAGNSAIIFDANTGERGRYREFLYTVTSCKFSPDGRNIATVSNSGKESELIIWDRLTGEIVHTFPSNPGQLDAVFSPDGSRLATTIHSVGRNMQVQIWDLATYKAITTLANGSNTITRIVYRPDDKQIAVGGWDQTVSIWDTLSNKRVHQFHEEAAVLGLAFSPDGSRLASCCKDGTVKIWAPPGLAVRTIQGNGRGLAFSPNGSRLATSGSAPVIVDVATGKERRMLTGSMAAYGRITWSRDGKYLGMGSDQEIWNAATGEEAQIIQKAAITIPKMNGSSSRGIGASFGPDGRYFAAVLSDREVAVWDLTTGKVAHRIKIEDTFGRNHLMFFCLAFHPNGVHLAVGIWKEAQIPQGSLEVWNVATGKKVHTFDTILDGVMSVEYSPRGDFLAAGFGKGTVASRWGEVRVWNTSTGEEITIQSEHSRSVYSVAFDPTGNRLASCSCTINSGQMLVLDLKTRLPVFSRFEGGHKPVSVAFSPCGRYIACGNDPGPITILDCTPLAETPAYQPLPEAD